MAFSPLRANIYTRYYFANIPRAENHSFDVLHTRDEKTNFRQRDQITISHLIFSFWLYTNLLINYKL